MARTTTTAPVPLERLHVRVTGDADGAFRDSVANTLTEALAEHALQVKKVVVRVEPSDDEATAAVIDCGITVHFPEHPDAVAHGRGPDAPTALAVAMKKLRGAVQRALARPSPVAERPAQADPPPRESLMGRREGHAATNLEKVLARPANGAKSEHTAQRNARKDTAGMTAALEDSLQPRPSRKSTRKSANRQKQATALTNRQKMKLAAPSADHRRR